MTRYALGLRADRYPQRRDWREMPWLDRWAERLRTAAIRHWQGREAPRDAFVRAVDAAGEGMLGLDEAGLRRELASIRHRLRREGPVDAAAARAFALIRLHSERLLGMRHFASQLKGGHALLHGNIAEMDTGEGKSLTATLAAATMALAGNAVHIITVNDYLAARDAEEMQGLFAALGLSTGLVLEKTSPAEKREQYRRDIVYCTSKILTFDYLRDRLTLGNRMQPLRMALDDLVSEAEEGTTFLRGLQYAIVDEADSVFIDEARTPLIISVERPDSALEDFYRQAVALADELLLDEHYTLAGQGRDVQLTEAGQQHLMRRAAELPALWQGRLRREQVIRQALVARFGFRRDIDYIVRDEKVMIVDENTGRVMPDRSWEQGLHQLIEIREGLPVSPEKETLARISFQMFFRRYLCLSGMTGTCREVAGEIGEVYGLPVLRIQPHRPSQRRALGSRIFATADARWSAVLAAVQERLAAGQAVLVGTRSIVASEALAQRFSACGIAHQVLNAKQDGSEAELVAQAGMPGKVTIATNMAGRGTDIKLDPAVEAAGGLHVILTERHDNARVDRQLIGRCARQGNPGSWEALYSLEDELFAHFAPGLVGYLKRRLLHRPDDAFGQSLGLALYRFAQWRVERRHGALRRRLLGADFRLRKSLSFSGQME